jgi:hypothetical protein
MADFTLRSAWIEGTDASGRAGSEWHERSGNPACQEALEALAALVSETSEPGWSAAALAEAIGVPGARIRIAEGGGRTEPCLDSSWRGESSTCWKSNLSA